MDEALEFSQRIRLEMLRTRILLLLDEKYPGSIHSDVIYWRSKEETSINEIVRELHYLEEKKMVVLENIVAERFLVAITAKGRDFIAGAIVEIGLFEVAKMI